MPITIYRIEGAYSKAGEKFHDGEVTGKISVDETGYFKGNLWDKNISKRNASGKLTLLGGKTGLIFLLSISEDDSLRLECILNKDSESEDFSGTYNGSSRIRTKDQQENKRFEMSVTLKKIMSL